MDKPRLRPLEVFPLETEQGRMIALRDPSGLTDAIALLPPPLVAIVQLFDGRRDRREIAAEFFRRHQQMLPPELLDELLSQLDEGLFLDSDTFHAHVNAVKQAFAAAPVREAAHAGKSYPGKLDELRPFLDNCFAPGDPVPPPRALIAPHIDLHRGGAAYGATYRALAATDAELFVIFGTDHVGADHPFTLTRKHYATPLGDVTTDTDLVDKLASRVDGSLDLFADELHHRTEHSIEFQALLLRHVLGSERPIHVLPVLCGSLHAYIERRDDPTTHAGIARFLDTLAELTEGRKVCIIAGADLAHVGPRFGDAHPLREPDRDRLARLDAATLEACSKGDARAFLDTVRADRDARRICGIAPIYHTLHLVAGARGDVVAYDQCPADEDGGSLVSIAGVVLR
jgi:MEMO1 family protein